MFEFDANWHLLFRKSAGHLNRFGFRYDAIGQTSMPTTFFEIVANGTLFTPRIIFQIQMRRRDAEFVLSTNSEAFLFRIRGPLGHAPQLFVQSQEETHVTPV